MVVPGEEGDLQAQFLRLHQGEDSVVHGGEVPHGEADGAILAPVAGLVDVLPEAGVVLKDENGIVPGDLRHQGVRQGAAALFVLHHEGVLEHHPHPLPAGGPVFDPLHGRDGAEGVVNPKMEVLPGGLFRAHRDDEEGLHQDEDVQVLHFPLDGPGDPRDGQKEGAVVPALEPADFAPGAEFLLLGRRDAVEGAGLFHKARGKGGEGGLREERSRQDQKNRRDCTRGFPHVCYYTKPCMGKQERASTIVFTGGGTGGHVYPGIAVIQVLRRKWKGSFLWVGSRSGMERAIVEAAEIGRAHV